MVRTNLLTEYSPILKFERSILGIFQTQDIKLKKTNIDELLELTKNYGIGTGLFIGDSFEYQILNRALLLFLCSEHKKTYLKKLNRRRNR